MIMCYHICVCVGQRHNFCQLSKSCFVISWSSRKLCSLKISSRVKAHPMQFLAQASGKQVRFTESWQSYCTEEKLNDRIDAL